MHNTRHGQMVAVMVAAIGQVAILVLACMKRTSGFRGVSFLFSKRLRANHRLQHWAMEGGTVRHKNSRT